MHVSPAKHSYAWLSRKCDYRTDRHTHTQTDAGQSDPYVPLCFAGDTKSISKSFLNYWHRVTDIANFLIHYTIHIGWACFGTLRHLYQIFNFFVWLRVTGEGSVPEIRTWSRVSKYRKNLLRYITIFLHSIISSSSTQLLLCLFTGVLLPWPFLYSVGPHPGSSFHIYPLLCRGYS